MTGRKQRPEDCIGQWRAFLEELEKGYDDCEPELEFDFISRHLIQQLIDDPDLNKFKDHKLFIAEIETIDDQIRELIYPNPKYIDKYNADEWWHFALLRKGRKKYVDDIKHYYGIDIELIP